MRGQEVFSGMRSGQVPLSTLIGMPVSVDSKLLIGTLSSLDATLAKKHRG